MKNLRRSILIGLLCVLAPGGEAAAAPVRFAAGAFEGAWRTSEDQLLIIGHSDDALFVFDEATSRRLGAHLAADGRELLLGTAGQLRLAGDEWLTGRIDGRSLQARRAPLSQEEVRWSSGGVTLSGTLWRPQGSARTAAVVLVHGSGPETRFAMRQFPAWLAAHGLTVIAYDKRAKYQPWDAGIDVLASDALGAVTLLRHRPDVDPSSVGLLGISNGAFVIVHAAAKSPDVAFIVPIVGGGGPLWQHELHRLHEAGVAARLGSSTVTALDGFMKDFYRPETFAPAGKAKLAAALSQARGQRWLSVTPLAQFVDAPVDMAFDVGRRAWANELSYDPSADLDKIGTRPALFVLAGEDEDIDSSLCSRDVKAHAAHARVIVLEKTNHYLQLSSSGHGDESTSLSPALFSSLSQFIARLPHVK